MSAQGNLNRDGIFGNLFIKGKEVIDKFRNLSVNNGIFNGNVKIKNTLNTGDTLIDGNLEVNADTVFNGPARFKDGITVDGTILQVGLVTTTPNTPQLNMEPVDDTGFLVRSQQNTDRGAWEIKDDIYDVKEYTYTMNGDFKDNPDGTYTNVNVKIKQPWDTRRLEEYYNRKNGRKNTAYIRQWATDGSSYMANVKGFNKYRIVPHIFRDGTESKLTNMSSTIPLQFAHPHGIAGNKFVFNSPLFVPPMGAQQLANDMEARSPAIGASNVGCGFCLSSASDSISIRTIAKSVNPVFRAPLMYQIYGTYDEPMLDEIMEESQNNGFVGILQGLDNVLTARVTPLTKPWNSATGVPGNSPYLNPVTFGQIQGAISVEVWTEQKETGHTNPFGFPDLLPNTQVGSSRRANSFLAALFGRVMSDRRVNETFYYNSQGDTLPSSVGAAYTRVPPVGGWPIAERWVTNGSSLGLIDTSAIPWDAAIPAPMPTVICLAFIGFNNSLTPKSARDYARVLTVNNLAQFGTTTNSSTVIILSATLGKFIFVESTSSMKSVITRPPIASVPIIPGSDLNTYPITRWFDPRNYYVNPAEYPGTGTSGTQNDFSTYENIATKAHAHGMFYLLKSVFSKSDIGPVIQYAPSCDGVIIGNHGGRWMSSGSAIDELKDAVIEMKAITDLMNTNDPMLNRNYLTMGFDSGVRSGDDAAKAILLGADIVGVGRPVLWASSIGGPAGVTQVLGNMMNDLYVIPYTLGKTSIDDMKGLDISSPNEFLRTIPSGENLWG